MQSNFIPVVITLISITCSTVLCQDLPVWMRLPVASIFQPVFKNDTAASKQIILSKEEIKADVFPGYVAYRIELLFINSNDKTILLDVGFPLCNADSSKEINCRNIYWPRLSVSGSLPTAPQLIYAGDGNHELQTTAQNQNLNWQKWNIPFLPGATQVVLNYGISTSGVQLKLNNQQIDGNGFQFAFSENNFFGKGNFEGKIWLRMNGGLVTGDIMSLTPDSQFLAGNSIVYADISKMNDKIIFWYHNTGGIKPSSVSWEMNYAKLKSWVTNDKIVATLSNYSAVDYEGKKFITAADNDSKVKWINWGLGGGVVLIVLVLIFFFGKKKS